jgi:protein-L-isoaspartate(D-aspartate) O-methyltransferase
MRIGSPDRTVVSASIAVWLAGSCAVGQGPRAEDSYEAARHGMVETQLAGRDIRDLRVLDAMKQVPRHLFVPEEMRHYAYVDSPLPIGRNQTISQPYIVALMTQLAEPEPDDRALEVGTGSGYQAAILSRLVEHVYTIEIIPELAERAGKTLRGLGYDNVTVRSGDGYGGWPERAPFDIIMVTAAAPHLPASLQEQLADRGRLIIPVGDPGMNQILVRYRKKHGKLERENVLPVVFVPMTGRVEGPD